MILKSDQAAAMVALQTETRKELWQEFIEIMNRLKQSGDRTEDQIEELCIAGARTG